MKTNSNSSWIDELIKWENAHPEYKPFKTDFITISFGPSDDIARTGWWNRKERFDNLNDAKQNGRQQLSKLGTFGYVVIEEGEDFWEVVDELGAPSHAVSVTAKHFTYSVQPSQELALV